MHRLLFRNLLGAAVLYEAWGWTIAITGIALPLIAIGFAAAVFTVFIAVKIVRGFMGHKTAVPLASVIQQGAGMARSLASSVAGAAQVPL